MNSLQKVLMIIAILLFLAIGLLVLLLLFGGAMVSSAAVAVIPLHGEISDDYDTGINSKAVIEVLEAAADDSSVVAIVLDIDSAGGGVVASKEIARSIAKLSSEKPVVARVGDSCASGAYYIASFSDAIIADSDSIVGSIGVISTYQNYRELFEDKLGINTTVIKSGDFKDMGSPYRGMSEVEEQRLQEIVDAIHEEFLATVAANRNLVPGGLEMISTGNIFLGSEAVGLGLVDELGGLDYAVSHAAELSGNPDAKAHFVDSKSSSENDPYYSIGRGLGDAFMTKMSSSSEGLVIRSI